MWVIKYNIVIDRDVSIPREISFVDLEAAFRYIDQVRPAKFKMKWAGKDDKGRVKNAGFMLKLQAV